MSKAIDEMRAYFNQPPVPPAGALLEHRKKVNRWIDEVEAENAKLRELVKRMWYVFIGIKRATFADRLRTRHEIDELGIEVDK